MTVPAPVRRPTTVAVLHGAMPANAPPDEQDVFTEVDIVTRALAELAYIPVAVPLTLDLDAARRRLLEVRPAFVFNLVESVDGLGRLAHLAQALLDTMGLRYTGAGGDAAFAASNKLVAKRLLTAAGVPTPLWVESRDTDAVVPDFHGPYIVKPAWEHASIGLDDGSVIADPRALPALLRTRRRDRPGDWFVERFIAGRELNLSLLAGPEGVEILPPAEIKFVDYPADKPTILDYAAKWHPDSFEYRHTVRSFEFPESDRSMLAGLEASARVCWRLFGLRGYARVDYRVDAGGRLWVLDININPCLSPDAGFAAAAAHAGLALSDVVRRIVTDLPRDASGLAE